MQVTQPHADSQTQLLISAAPVIQVTGDNNMESCRVRLADAARSAFSRALVARPKTQSLPVIMKSAIYPNTGLCPCAPDTLNRGRELHACSI